MSDLAPEVTAIAEAIQRLANTDEQYGNAVVTQALVIYEAAGFHDDGEPWRRVAYSIPTDNFSVTGGLGLIEAARFYIRRDALDESPDDD